MKKVWLALATVGLLLATGSAQAQGFGQNKVQYENFVWNYISSPHFDIYFYEGGYDLAVFSAEVLESAYVQVSAQLDHRLRKKVPTIIYQSHNEFQQTNVTGGLLPEGVGGFTESFKNRMVMPFTGSYEDFRHVLHHELTHAVTFDKIYGEGVGSIISRRSFFDLPLWFAEGFAEYSSRHGWDTFADMVIRDATVHNYLVPLQYVGGYLAYKQGQSAVLYMAERYGEAKISELLNKGRFEMSMDNVLRKTIGMGEEEFNEDWQKRLRKEYWPEISVREEPKDFAKQLTDHEKDGSYYNDKPVFSPRGDRLAILSERADYTEVKIISAVDGKRLQRVLKGGSSDRFESLHSYLSAMSFSPDGSTLGLITKSSGHDVLFLANVDGKGSDRSIPLDFSSLRSPTFSPDGNSVVLVGCRQGRNDLYRVDIASGGVTRLTNDRYDEQDPEFDPSGNKIVFACDRPAVKSSLMVDDVQDPRTFRYGRYNIFEADLSTATVRPLTDDDAECKMPVYAPDGERICYVSNANGIYNLYVIDSGETRQYPITDALSGCFSPSWAPDGKSIAFTAFFKGGFDVFLMKEIRPRGDSAGLLTPTAFVRRLTGADSGTFVQRKDIDLEEQAPKAIEEDLEFTSYVKRAESPLSKQPLPEAAAADSAQAAAADSTADTTAIAESDSARATDKIAGAARPSPIDSLAATELAATDTSFEVHRYKLKFSPDLVTGGLGYDTFFGLRGQSYFVISDYMGDHQIYIASDLINTIDQSNIQVFYAYRPKRIDWGFGIFHSKYYYLDFTDRLFSDRTYGFQGIASRPFSKFTRLELDGMMIFIDRRYFDPDENGDYDDRSDRVGLGALALVHDNANWGLTGPVSGRRYRVNFEIAPEGVSDGISYQALTADARQYIRIGGRYSLGLRLAGGTSGGKNPKRFYLGGVSNWVGSDIARSDVYDVDGLYFSQVITPFRGYDYYAISGNKFVMANLEFRFPFVDYLQLRFPLPMILSRVGGAVFTDIGSAWTNNDTFQGATSEDGFHLKDIRMSFGYGLRANLGFVVLRFDQAWRTDLKTVGARPAFYFSLGADY